MNPGRMTRVYRMLTVILCLVGICTPARGRLPESALAQYTAYTESWRLMGILLAINLPYLFVLAICFFRRTDNTTIKNLLGITSGYLIIAIASLVITPASSRSLQFVTEHILWIPLAQLLWLAVAYPLFKQLSKPAK